MEYRLDIDYSLRGLNLKLDNNILVKESAFWIGHFETLHGAKIIVEPDDMSFEI